MKFFFSILSSICSHSLLMFFLFFFSSVLNMSILLFQHNLLKDKTSSFDLLLFHSIKSVGHTWCVYTYGLFIFFHRSVCLFIHLYHTFLITPLCINLKIIVIPPTFSFFFNFVLVILVPFLFMIAFRIILSMFT